MTEAELCGRLLPVAPLVLLCPAALDCAFTSLCGVAVLVGGVAVLLWLAADPVAACDAAVSPDCGSVLLLELELAGGCVADDDWLADWLDCGRLLLLCVLLLCDPFTQVSHGGCVVLEVAEEEVGGSELEELEADDPLGFEVDGGFDIELGGLLPALPTVRLLTMVAPGAAERAISSARCLS